MAATSGSMTEEQARQKWSNVEQIINQGDIDKTVAGFDDNVVVRFADLPEMRGKDALTEFFKAVFAARKGYRINKTFKSVANNIIGGLWEGEWIDAQSGKAMRERGAEFAKYADGRIIEWEGAFNAWEKK